MGAIIGTGNGLGMTAVAVGTVVGRGAAAGAASWRFVVSAMGGKCQRRGPVSSRQPERMG